MIHRPLRSLLRIGATLGGGLAVPEACDWHRYIAMDGDALGNLEHGCCVPAAAFRAVQMRRAVQGDQRKPTTDEVLGLYRRWAQWDGTEATDIGTPSDAAAAQWQRDGIAWGGQWLDVPDIFALAPAAASHLRAAIAWLGPVMLDLALPLAWQGADAWVPFGGPAGAPGSWGAHRVCAGRYDSEWLYAVTWGREVRIPWGALAVYGLHAEVPVSRSWLDTHGLSPGGLGLDALRAEAREVAG